MKYSFANFVRQGIARQVGLPEHCVEPAQRLREDLGLLPLDLVLVTLSLEDVANARFPVEHLDSVKTVGELTWFLWSCRCAAPSDPRRSPNNECALTDAPCYPQQHAG
ncbi:MAG TPA: hypothetical protein VHC69_02690 [Polyangiaceae bacterium]|nr:hypothetical protein [Polyangiaceae bacterium]